MEFLEGRNLKEVVREHGALDPALAVDLVIQILKAARFAHRRGIVHRDIKPHNVIVDDEGRAKVTDFGIARAGASDMTETGLDHGHGAVPLARAGPGPPGRRAHGPLLDRRSSSTSCSPARCRSMPSRAVTIALKQVSEPPIPPTQRNPAVPPALDAVVLRALRKDPDERYQDADAFIEALERALRGLRRAAVARTRAVLEEDDRRRWGRIAAIAIVVLALAALAVGAYLLLRPSRPRCPTWSASAPTRRRSSCRTAASRSRSCRSSPTRSRRTASRARTRSRERGRRGLHGHDHVSSGPGEAPVPLVQGLPADEAADRLREAGFRSEQQREFSDTVRNGRVIETTPAEGSTVRKGSTVTLVVSRGKEKVAVPDVVGRDARRRRAAAARRRPARPRHRARVRRRGSRHRARAGSRRPGRRSPRAHGRPRRRQGAGRGARSPT